VNDLLVHFDHEEETIECEDEDDVVCEVKAKE